MEREGIDVSVLFPTIGSYIMWRDDIDPELSAAICRAYNTWLADYCDHDRKRLYGVMLLPLQDPKRAVEELKYAREKLGLVGIFWRPNKFCGRTLSSPDYYPILRCRRGTGCDGVRPRGRAHGVAASGQ
jgi:predicted TIM-barrel fold metal-dependent hydrolase